MSDLGTRITRREGEVAYWRSDRCSTLPRMDGVVTGPVLANVHLSRAEPWFLSSDGSRVVFSRASNLRRVEATDASAMLRPEHSGSTSTVSIERAVRPAGGHSDRCPDRCRSRTSLLSTAASSV